MKKLFFLIALTTIFSCKEKFNPKEFKGTWIPLYNDSTHAYLPLITFKNDSVFLEDIYTYTITGNYLINKNSIKFYLKNDTLDYNFNFNRKDSILKINDKNYTFYEGFSYDTNLKTYELIGINRKKNISADSLSNFEVGFHLLKNKNDSTILKLNDRFTSDFDLIPRFIFGIHHRLFNKTVIYIGKRITLKDIIKVYQKLYSVNQRGVFLVTSFNLRENSYSGFLDHFDFWEEQENKFMNERVERPLIPNNNREIYILKHTPKIIKINSKNDFEKFDEMKKENNYLISINPNMNIEDYINLKEKIFKVDKNIRTEFDLTNSEF